MTGGGSGPRIPRACPAHAAVFVIFDADGDGWISESDLRKVVSMLVGGTQVSPMTVVLNSQQATPSAPSLFTAPRRQHMSEAALGEVVRRTMDAADVDRDGRISFEDFSQACALGLRCCCRRREACDLPSRLYAVLRVCSVGVPRCPCQVELAAAGRGRSRHDCRRAAPSSATRLFLGFVFIVSSTCQWGSSRLLGRHLFGPCLARAGDDVPLTPSRFICMGRRLRQMVSLGRGQRAPTLRVMLTPGWRADRQPGSRYRRGVTADGSGSADTASPGCGSEWSLPVRQTHSLGLRPARSH